LKLVVTIGFMLAIFLSSLIATDGSAPGFEFFRDIPPAIQNLLHIPLFFIFTLALIKVFAAYEYVRRVQIASAIILANYVGILNEWLQLATGERHFSFLDMGYNLIGAIIAVIVYLFAAAPRI
jgi:VanZ family protein